MIMAIVGLINHYHTSNIFCLNGCYLPTYVKMPWLVLAEAEAPGNWLNRRAKRTNFLQLETRAVSKQHAI